MRRISALLVGLVLHLAVYAWAGWRPLERLARELAQGAPKGAKLKVAVLEFTYLDGTPSSGSGVVQEQLTTLLAGADGIQVLERRLMDKVLQELKLESTGLVDAGAAGRSGGFLGVDAVVAGTLHDLDRERTEVHARMIDFRTGQVLSAADAEMRRTWPPAPNPAPAQPPVPALATRPLRAAPARTMRSVERTPREEEGFLRFFIKP
jgi:TolB-like protein